MDQALHISYTFTLDDDDDDDTEGDDDDDAPPKYPMFVWIVGS